MDDHELEAALEELIRILPRGFNVTLGLHMVDGALIAHAAVHTQEPNGRVVLEETGAGKTGAHSASTAVRKLRAHLRDSPLGGP